MAEYEDAEGTTREERSVDQGGQYLDEGGYNERHDREDPGNPLWDESLIVLLLVGGVLLLLLPEPVTSALGVLLIAVGVLAWLVDAIG